MTKAPVSGCGGHKTGQRDRALPAAKASSNSGHQINFSGNRGVKKNSASFLPNRLLPQQRLRACAKRGAFALRQTYLERPAQAPAKFRFGRVMRLPANSAHGLNLHARHFSSRSLIFFSEPCSARFVISSGRSQIILGHKMPGKIVRVFVILPMAQPLRAGIMGVAQFSGTGSVRPERTSSSAASMATQALLLLWAVAI